MVLEPTDFESEYGVNFKKMDKDIKKLRTVVIIIGILNFIFKLALTLVFIFLAIYLYNLIF